MIWDTPLEKSGGGEGRGGGLLPKHFCKGKLPNKCCKRLCLTVQSLQKKNPANNLAFGLLCKDDFYPPPLVFSNCLSLCGCGAGFPVVGVYIIMHIGICKVEVCKRYIHVWVYKGFYILHKITQLLVP